MRADPALRLGRIFAVLATLACLAPLPLLLGIATTASWRRGLWSSGITLEWLIDGWGRVAPYAEVSVKIALIVLAADLLIGFPAAWALARLRFPGRRLLLSLIALPIAIPGIALALALILAYPLWKQGGWLLVGGHILYTLPFFIGGIVPLLDDARLLEQEAAAATLGANQIRQFLFVTLPFIRTGLLVNILLIFTLSMGEFNISFFLFTPLQKPMPVELYASYITGRLEVAAATTVWFLMFVLPAAVIIEALGGGRIRGQV